MLLMLLVNCQRFLIQAVLSSNSGNVSSIVTLKPIDITNDLALVGTDGIEEQQVLQVFVITEK